MDEETTKPARPIRSTDRIYERVKTMVASYRIKPGERINEVEMSRQLGISRTPLREALSRLTSEGLLTSTANRGFSARSLDAQGVMNLYEYRVAVECGAARLACRRVAPEELKAFESFAAHSRDEPEDLQAIRLLQLDEEFHERLARLSGNEEFVRSVRSINEKIRFVRWIDMRKGLRPATQGEHMKIVARLKAHDEEGVCALLQRHISRRLDQIMEVIKDGYAEIYTGNALACDLVDRAA